MVIWSSTQNPSHTQEAVANVLGIPQNRIVLKGRRSRTEEKDAKRERLFFSFLTFLPFFSLPFVCLLVKRMGGGFGGKETRSIFISAAAAIAARKFNRPVRLLLDRDVDMAITGGKEKKEDRKKGRKGKKTEEGGREGRKQGERRKKKREEGRKRRV